MFWLLRSDGILGYGEEFGVWILIGMSRSSLNQVFSLNVQLAYTHSNSKRKIRTSKPERPSRM